MSNKPDWMDIGISTIRIEHGELLHTNSPYQMELLAIASALHLLHSTNRTATIWSDCLSAVTTINSMTSLSAMGASPNHPLFKTIFHILSNNPSISIKWCKSHPDINKQHDWTHQEWGNHLADLVAGGKPLPENLLNVNSSTALPATEVATDIQSSWFWSAPSSNTLLLTDILNDARDSRWENYQSNRDAPHELADEEPLHLGSAMEFSAYLFNLPKLPITKRASAVRLIMDKHVQGRLYSKMAKTDADKLTFSLCPLCKQPDSQYHFIFDCNYPQAKRIRQETLLEATNAATLLRAAEQAKQDASFAQHPTEPPTFWRTQAFDTVTEAFFTSLTSHPHAHLLYTGRYSASLIESLRFQLNDFPVPSSKWRSPPVRNILRNTLRQYGQIYARSAQSLWSQRHSAAIQVHEQLALLPPETTVNIPRVPHADDCIRRSKAIQDQAAADEKEGLTSEDLLGIILPDLVPESPVANRPTILPPEEVQEIVSSLTHVPRRHNLHPLSTSGRRNINTTLTTS